MCGVWGGPGPGLVQWQLLLVGCIVVPLSLRAQGYPGAVELFSSKCCQCLLQSRLLGTVMAPVLWLILIAPISLFFAVSGILSRFISPVILSLRLFCFSLYCVPVGS